MNPLKIIQKYYDADSRVYEILVVHSELVRDKALQLADAVSHLNPDLQFVAEAAMLHDIGIFMTKSPKIGCQGEHPYIMHGILGRELLEKEGLSGHALVCERHIGMGLSKKDIKKQKLPLPERDMLPVSIEEKIICFADNFYGKNPRRIYREKSLEKIAEGADRYGDGSKKRFKEFVELFGLRKV